MAYSVHFNQLLVVSCTPADPHSPRFQPSTGNVELAIEAAQTDLGNDTASFGNFIIHKPSFNIVYGK